MKLNVYSIFDTASGLYSRPFFTSSDAEALRSFSDIATDAEHPIGKHPKDYTLFRIGTFDDNKGHIHNEDNESLATALELIAKTRTVNQTAQRDLVQEINQTKNNGETPLSNEEILEGLADKLQDLT